MSLPASQPIPEESDNLDASARARRRRERRRLLPVSAGDRDQHAAFLDSLAVRAIPSFDFFVFSLLAGLAFGLSFLFDSPAIALLGAILAPFLGPFVGLSLATIIGSGRFFMKSLVCAAIGALLAGAGGLAAGFAPHFLPGLPMPLTWVASQTQLSWPGLIVIGVLAIATTLAYIRSTESEPKALLPSVGLAYLLYLPLAAAGFGFSAGATSIWAHGLIMFAVHLALAVLLGTITLAIAGLRPLTVFGYSLGATIALSSLVFLAGLGGLGSVIRGRQTIPVVLPTPVPPTATRPTATHTLVPPTLTATLSSTPTNTLVPSQTPTVTITPAPTPIWAIVNAASLNGAYIRAEPKVGSKILTSVLNGTLVKVIPGTVQDGSTLWAHIHLEDGTEGWIVQSLLITATPVPGW